jgi:hypothetical protein
LSKAIAGAAIGAVVAAGAVTLDILSAGGAVALTPLEVSAVSAAMGIGTSMLSSSIASVLTGSSGMALTTRQTAAPRAIIYGQQRVGGNMVYVSTTGDSHDQWNAIIVLAGHECDSLVNLYLDGRQVHWLGSGPGYVMQANGIGFGGVADNNTYTGPDGLQYNFGGTGHSGIYCEMRTGNQPNFDLMLSLTANDPNWAESLNGTPSLMGCTYIYLKVEYNPSLFPNLPDVRVTVNGKNNIFDPRTQATGFTTNNALIAADVITDTVFGLGDGTVNQAQLTAAANVCDEQIQLAVSPGTLQESQYACSYRYDTSMAPGDALQTIMSGMAGRLSRIGGEWYIWPAYFQGSSASFGLSVLTGGVKWNPNRAFRDLINRVNGTYIAPSYPFNIAGNLYDQNGFYNGQIQNNFPFGFQPTSAPQYAHDTLHGYAGGDEFLTADGGVELPMQMALATCLSVTQWQRVAKINLMRNRFQGTGTLTMGLGAYQLQPADVFSQTFPFLNWEGKMLEVSSVNFTITEDESSGAQYIGLSVSVNETDPSVYEWDPDAEELTVEDAPASPNQAPRIPAPPTAMTLASGPGIASVNADGTVNNYIQIGWNTPADLLAVEVQIQYQVAGSASWLSAPTVDISLTNGLIPNVVPGTAYNVQIRSARANGTVSTWVTQNSYKVVADASLGTLAAQLPVLTANSELAGTVPGEMLTNGNFAKGTTGEVTGWTGSDLTISTAEFLNGTQSLQLLNASASQSVNVIAGHTYRMSCWIMTNGSVTGSSGFGAGFFVSQPGVLLTMLATDAPPSQFSGGSMLASELEATSATPWTQINSVFKTSTSGSLSVNLQNSVGGGTVSGTAWFAGASLTDVTAQSAQLGGVLSSLITPIAALMPAQAGADKTSANQSATTFSLSNQSLDSLPDGQVYIRPIDVSPGGVYARTSSFLASGGMVPSTVSSGIFNASVTNTHISIWNTSEVIFFPDGSSLTIPATGSSTAPGWIFTVNPSTIYVFSAYYVIATKLLNVIPSDLGGGGALASQQQIIQDTNADGHIGLIVNWEVESGATGTSSGGGSPPPLTGCPADDQEMETLELGFVEARCVEAGMHVRDSDGEGWNLVGRAWSVDGPLHHITIGGERLHVDLTHRWLRPGGDSMSDIHSDDWVSSRDLLVGDSVQGADGLAYAVEEISESHMGRYRKITCGKHRMRLGKLIAHNWNTDNGG